LKFNLLILAFLFCSIQLLRAQANESPSDEPPTPSKNYYKRAYLGMAYGFAIPMGTFSANTISDGNSAYANGGGSFNALEVGYRVRSNFFVSGKYTIIRNGVDETTMEDELQSITGFNYQISASDYNLKAVMLGAGLTKRSNAIDIDLRFYMGFGTTFLPTFNVMCLYQIHKVEKKEVSYNSLIVSQEWVEV
jgi:hypothetical protein